MAWWRRVESSEGFGCDDLIRERIPLGNNSNGKEPFPEFRGDRRLINFECPLVGAVDMVKICSGQL